MLINDSNGVEVDARGHFRTLIQEFVSKMFENTEYRNDHLMGSMPIFDSMAGMSAMECLVNMVTVPSATSNRVAMGNFHKACFMICLAAFNRPDTWGAGGVRLKQGTSKSEMACMMHERAIVSGVMQNVMDKLMHMHCSYASIWEKAAEFTFVLHSKQRNEDCVWHGLNDNIVDIICEIVLRTCTEYKQDINDGLNDVLNPSSKTRRRLTV
jgi:hypothetical protein